MADTPIIVDIWKSQYGAFVLKIPKAISTGAIIKIWMIGMNDQEKWSAHAMITAIPNASKIQ